MMVASSCRQGCDLLVARMYTPAAAATKGQQKFKHATLIKHSACLAGSMGVGYASWWRLLNFWESQSGICWGETRVSQLHKEHVPPPPPHPNNTSVAPSTTVAGAQPEGFCRADPENEDKERWRIFLKHPMPTTSTWSARHFNV